MSTACMNRLVFMRGIMKGRVGLLRGNPKKCWVREKGLKAVVQLKIDRIAPRLFHPSAEMPKIIKDEFTGLPVSPQRKYQLRMKRDGRCVICGRAWNFLGQGFPGVFLGGFTTRRFAISLQFPLNSVSIQAYALSVVAVFLC